MKTCLVQAATGANIYLGLGNGHSGPVALSTAGAESVSSAQVQLDSAGRVLITKAAAFPDTLCVGGDSVLVSQGTAIQYGVYQIADKIGTDSLILAPHRSRILCKRWKVTYTALPADGDTFTAGGVTYRFKTTTANPNDVLLQADATATLTSLLLALGLTGTGQAGGSASPDYINTTVFSPLFKSGGISGTTNSGFILVDSRLNDWPSLVAPTLTGAWGTIAEVPDLVPPAIGSSPINVHTAANCAVRLGAPRGDKWSGIGAVKRMKALALAGTTPTLQLYSCRHIQAPSGTSGPVNGHHDILLAAPALALPIGIEVDLGDNPTRFGGLLFRVAGTNPVVLISYD